MVHHIKNLLNKEFNNRTVSRHDIGVVTPYVEQVRRIKTAIRNRFNEAIAVGTAEHFQGQERSVMIISTVRTNGVLGFVKDAKVDIYCYLDSFILKHC